MTLNVSALPTNHSAGDSAHVAGHNAANDAINTIVSYIVASLPSNADLASAVATAVAAHAAAADPHADRAYTDTQTATRQPLDADLTSIAAISPSNDDVIQRKAGAWTNRTPAQVKTDLALVKGDVGLGNVTNNAQVTGVTAGDATITIGGTSAAPTVAVTGSTFQPLDADLTTIAGLTATTDSFLQSKSSAWASRTPAQVAADLAGTSSTTLAAGNDSRITGAAQKASNLSDLASASTSRTNLGLGGAALLAVGTTAGTVAAGDDSRLTSTAQYLPADQGMIAWSGDPAWGSLNSSTAANGSVYLVGLRVRAAATISTLWISVGTVAATVTAGQNGLALYDSTGARLSTAMSDTIFTTAGLRSGTLAAAQSVTAGLYWVGILGNATTPVQLSRGTSILSTPNVGLTAATYRYCLNGTGQTSFPSSITPASNTQTAAFTFWAAAS
jgi:hypothetical protein